jgi:hypothetical protein
VTTDVLLERLVFDRFEPAATQSIKKVNSDSETLETHLVSDLPHFFRWRWFINAQLEAVLLCGTFLIDLKPLLRNRSKKSAPIAKRSKPAWYRIYRTSSVGGGL